METSAKVLQDVEEARVLVVSWRNDKIERLVARSAKTIERKTAHRIARKVKRKLWYHKVKEAYIEEVKDIPMNARKAFWRRGFHHAYYLLRKYGHCTTAAEAKIYFDARATSLPVVDRDNTAVKD